MKKQSFKIIGAVALSLALVTGAGAGSSNGSASEIPAFYDCSLFTIIFVQFSDTAAATLVQHNKSINNIYQQDTRVGGNPVIDAIPGDGFNPIWQEMQITFKAGHTPVRFCRDDDVVAAFNAGVITLTPTGEVYWCPVVGQKR